METVTTKVHHHRHRRGESRHRQRRNEQQQQQQQQHQEQNDQIEKEETPNYQISSESVTTSIVGTTPSTTLAAHTSTMLNPQHQGDNNSDTTTTTTTTTTDTDTNTNTYANTNTNTNTTAITTSTCDIVETHMSRTISTGTTASTLSRSSSQQTVLLVNGELSPPSNSIMSALEEGHTNRSIEPIAIAVIETNEIGEIIMSESQPNATAEGGGGGGEFDDPAQAGGQSSRNSSGDAQSLRETLRQLRPPKMSSRGGGDSGGGGNCGPGGSVGNSAGTSGQRIHHHHHYHHHHRERDRDRQHRTRSPRETSGSGTSAAGGATTAAVVNERTGILGFMERELRQCSPTPSTARSTGGGSGTGSAAAGTGGTRKLPSSLSDDPQASPAQRSIRSRSSLEKSPRRKRSKSESRRRRERKLIAAGEMEVRQANETLMRYLKQCSEMNDASLSGELEIDQSYDERRVHRKTKSQRDKRGHLISKLYTAGGGLSSLLKELSDDIVPAEGEEIYNPFTPVVSPTEDNAPAHIDKMFLQTSSGYRPVERCYYKHHHHYHMLSTGGGGGGGAGIGVGGINGNGIACVGNNGSGGGGGAGGSSGAGSTNSGIAAYYGSGNGRGHHFVGGSGCGSGMCAGGMHVSDSYGDDVRCLLDTDKFNGHEIRTNIQLACVIQRVWILVSNICHGLLAGLALAHLLFVLSSPHPMDWSRVPLAQVGDVGVISDRTTVATAASMTTETITVDSGGGTEAGPSDKSDSLLSPLAAGLTISHEIMSDYATFANIYLNTFFCLAIVCLVSVLDRMDICRWDLSNASEFISFRWLIIAMIYIATIILTICSNTIDEKLYYNNNANITMTEGGLFSNSILNVWSSLSVTRSISAICGWFMIGLTPHEDLLYEHLLDLTKYQLTNN